MEWFQAKGLKPGFDHTDVWREEHATSFTVAKAMELDVLTAIRAEAARAQAEGRTMREFAKTLTPRLQELGWWGRKEAVDPVTGEVREVQLGSPRRLATIYRTNMRTARAAGQWARIQRTKASHPFLLYELGPSRAHRPEHVGWHGTLLPVDDPWWGTHYPPNGWGCKCRVRQVSRAEAERLGRTGVQAPEPEPLVDAGTGLPTGHRAPARVRVQRQAPPVRTRPWKNIRTGETHQVPEGIDPGWDYNPGAAGRGKHAVRLLGDKIAAAPGELGGAAWTALPGEVRDTLAAEYRDWAGRIQAGERVGLGGRRTVGALSSAVREGLATLGVVPESAALTIEQREVTHLFAEARKGAKAVPEGVVLDLVRLLDAPLAVIWDGAGRRPALLYVVEVPGRAELGRIAVRVDYAVRGGVTNAVRSAGMVAPANLRAPGMVLLEGEIK